jgi:hypothetical protein
MELLPFKVISQTNTQNLSKNQVPSEKPYGPSSARRRATFFQVARR